MKPRVAIYNYSFFSLAFCRRHSAFLRDILTFFTAKFRIRQTNIAFKNNATDKTSFLNRRISRLYIAIATTVLALAFFKPRRLYEKFFITDKTFFFDRIFFHNRHATKKIGVCQVANNGGTIT